MRITFALCQLYSPTQSRTPSAGRKSPNFILAFPVLPMLSPVASNQTGIAGVCSEERKGVVYEKQVQKRFSELIMTVAEAAQGGLTVSSALREQLGETENVKQACARKCGGSKRLHI